MTDVTFTADDIISGANQTRLRTIIERVERLEEDKAAIMGDIKEVYDEAKGEGWDSVLARATKHTEEWAKNVNHRGISKAQRAKA